ncbi:MAG: hypothetical protein ACRYG8_05980 [Janthinobacterium lividum]
MALPFQTPTALADEIDRLHAIEQDGTSWDAPDFDTSPGSVASQAMWSHLKTALDDPSFIADAHLIARVTRCLVRSTGGSELPYKAALLLADTVLSAPPATGSDAEILTACADLDKLEREYAAVSLADEDSPRLDAIAVAQAPLVSLLSQTKAETIKGIRAKAHSLALWDSSLMAPRTSDVGSAMMGSILRDLVAAMTPTTDTDTDTNLIALCDECCRLEAESVRLHRLDGHENEKESGRVEDEARVLFDRILTMEPTTAEGRSAVARVALWYVGREADGATISTDYIGEQLAWKLVRQLAGGDQRAELAGGAA